MRNAWERLIARYADGREICNCGQAYYENCGIGYIDGEKREDMPACLGGCSANQYSVKDYIARKVEAELNTTAT